MGFASDSSDLARIACRDAWGQAVTYTPASGPAVTLTGVFRTESVTLFDAEGMPVNTVRDVVDFRVADFGTLVPKSLDTLLTAGVTYTVVGVEEPCEGTVLCIVGRAR